MEFTQTYTMADENIPPTSWDEYSKYSKTEFRKLVDNDSEEAMQKFFEDNPSFVPGALGLQTISGHSPLHGCLFTQPKLPGLKSKIPDFMWISQNSTYVHPILIEIESPQKKVFNKNNSFTEFFTQAHTQIIDWRTWFSDPTNVLIFQREYAIDDIFAFNKRKIKPYFILLYGRANEIENSQERADRKASIAYENETIMTYDRLVPSNDQSFYFTGIRTADNFKVITFPEYLYLRPEFAKNIYRFTGINEAINKNHKISEKRKAFLYERIEYWRTWVESGASGMISSGDKE